jgi:ubiquinone biosynthesis monooxygenase Coq7
MATAKNIKHSARTQALLDKVLRVDQAGEFGAVQIYKGQLAVLGNTDVAPIIQEMLGQERVHLSTMDQLVPSNRVRPSVLLPIWTIAGFALGAGSALLGKEAAMACTVAVETVIGEHYDGQIRDLLADGKDGLQKHKHLIQTISKFRDEELEHLDIGLKHDAEQALAYTAFSEVIKFGCRGAIWLSERI